MIPLICYLNPAKGNARTMLEAFAAGSGAEITTKLSIQRGKRHVFWGVDRATLQLFHDVLASGEPYVYMDNGYLRSRWHGGDYYRITLSATQHSGMGTSDGKRFAALKIPIAPWREDGRHILLALQSDWWYERHLLRSAEHFAEMVTAGIRKHTDRPIIVRQKPLNGIKEPPLREQLEGCWAVVTHSSMVAFDALIAGIPAFVLSRSAMAPVTHDTLDLIESPLLAPDRERWLSVLADNQWRLSEIADGTAWRALR